MLSQWLAVEAQGFIMGQPKCILPHTTSHHTSSLSQFPPPPPLTTHKVVDENVLNHMLSQWLAVVCLLLTLLYFMASAEGACKAGLQVLKHCVTAAACAHSCWR